MQLVLEKHKLGVEQQWWGCKQVLEAGVHRLARSSCPHNRHKRVGYRGQLVCRLERHKMVGQLWERHKMVGLLWERHKRVGLLW